MHMDMKTDLKTTSQNNPTGLPPGLHSRLHFNHFVGDMNHTDSDITSFWMILPLQELVHSCLQEVAQLCLGKPWKMRQEEEEKMLLLGW